MLQALCQRQNHLYHWEQAIAALQTQEPSQDLLLAYRSAAKWSRIGFDRQRQLQYLQAAIDIAEELGNTIERLDLMAIKANTLLNIGYAQQAETELTLCVQQAIQVNYHLLVVAEGTILCGLWMRQGQLERVASLCLNIEESAISRCNWIALATGRMMRASCWMIQKSPKQAIALLFETGNYLYQQGAVVALNLIKARLGEFQLLIGIDKFEEIRQNL